jgi:hypothetical protein
MDLETNTVMLVRRNDTLRKPYATPLLTDHGAIVETTQGTGLRSALDAPIPGRADSFDA